MKRVILAAETGADILGLGLDLCAAGLLRQCVQVLLVLAGAGGDGGGGGPAGKYGSCQSQRQSFEQSA